MKSFSLNNFAPEEFFGGAKSVSMNGPKFSKSDRTMKAFSFVERNKNISLQNRRISGASAIYERAREARARTRRARHEYHVM